MKATYRNILVPTDFSALGNQVVDIAAHLCKQSRAVLHLIHVVDCRYLISSTEYNVQGASLMNEIDQESRTKLYNIYESLLRDHDIQVQIHMPTGIPFDEICKAATEMPVDLIVMSSHGASGLRAEFMGTTAYQVIKNATRAILIIPGTFKSTGFKNILFPVRKIPGNRKKYQYALSLLKGQDVSVHLAVLCDKGTEQVVPQDDEDIRELENAMQNEKIIFTKYIYYCNNPASQVLKISKAPGFDLIIIQATLDYKWTQFFLGKYTQQIVSHSTIPVLCFKEALNIPDEVKKEKTSADNSRIKVFFS